MNKAILLSTGIKLDVLGECGFSASANGLQREYRVKKETANAISTFIVTENEIIFIEDCEYGL